MGTLSLRKISGRIGGLGAALAVAATIGIGGASAASAAPANPCETENHKYCENSTVLHGHYATPLACDNQGRAFVNQVYERSGVTYGTYAWQCSSTGDQWTLTLSQYAYSNSLIMFS